MSKQMNRTTQSHHRHRTPFIDRECIVCGSKAIGMNFGAPTCAPCKAFFRRNARRKEILEQPCHHPDLNLLNEQQIYPDDMSMRYLQIRRCSSCRLRRCFEVGMNEGLIRSEEENEKHRRLVDNNRKRREILKKQEEQDRQLTVTEYMMNNQDLVNQIDWCHLSNIVYAYDKYCVKTYLEQRDNILTNRMLQKEELIKHYGTLPACYTYSINAFLQVLPAFQSLSRTNQSFLCKNNLRRMMLLNINELNQTCFTESWQAAAYKPIWEFICGPELYETFDHTVKLAEKFIITDPIMTRLWMIVIFFSTPLFSYYDPKTTVVKVRKNSLFIDIQNIYVNLLWKYLLYRHGPIESVRIFSNLIFVFLNMLHIGLNINIRLRTDKQFLPVHETLDALTKLDINAD